MLLLIDIGNTRTTIGLYANNTMNTIPAIRTLKAGEGGDTYACVFSRHLEEYKIEKPGGAVICSVVPWAEDMISPVIQDRFGIRPVQVDHTVKTGLTFSIRHAETLGADRIANAVAAHNLYQGDVIVVDFGSATTLCFITAKGEYRGGAILPGLGLSADVLAEKTAALPRVRLDPPDSVLGVDTAGNIRSGIIFGHAGAVERIISEIARETQKRPRVVITGGYSDIMGAYVHVDYANPLLTLDGLRFIYEMNTRERG